MIPASVLSEEVAWVLIFAAIGIALTIIATVMYAITAGTRPWHRTHAVPGPDGSHEQIPAGVGSADRVHAGV